MRPIDADEAIERIDALCEKYKSDIRNNALLKHTRTFIKRCPTVEPKTGYWIKTISENGITSAVRCSECGFEDNRYMLFRYCPNCGIKIVEQPQESEVNDGKNEL